MDKIKDGLHQLTATKKEYTMSTTLLETLVSLGLNCAQLSGTRASPDDYAQKAAHLAVREMMTKQGAESPDSIAFLGSVAALSTMLNSVHSSARLADKGVVLNTASKQYDIVLAEKSTSRKTCADTSSTDARSSYEEILNITQFQKLIEQIQAMCKTTQKQDLNTNESTWSDTFSMRYLQVYACARSAYLHAIAVSVRYTDLKQQKSAFEVAIRTRLREDLQGEVISSGFFIQAMCSPWMKAAGIFLLITGILALSLLAISFINPMAGTSLIAMGLNNARLIPACISGGLLGSAISTSRFFIQKNEQAKIKLSQEAIESTNNITPQMMV